VATTPDPTFGQVYWDAYDYTSDAVLVPYRLMQDSVFDIGTILGGMLGERLGRKVCQDDTTGSGANQPKGIVTAATLGVTTAGATAITFDEVLDLIFSVDPSHRANGRFMFHDLVLSTLRKLKDGQGKYLWEPSTQSGIPDRLWGYPYTINMEMSSTVAATDKTMLFGDLRKYKVRQVADVRFYRLTERYRDNDQDGFVAFSRQDGNLLTAGTAPVKYLQQHA
jgi:HK97 family phage major capsid protein